MHAEESMSAFGTFDGVCHGKSLPLSWLIPAAPLKQGAVLFIIALGLQCPDSTACECIICYLKYSKMHVYDGFATRERRADKEDFSCSSR